MLLTPTLGCDTAKAKPEPPLTLMEPSALLVTLTAAPSTADDTATSLKTGGGFDPKRSKGPLRDRLPIKISRAKRLPDKAGIVPAPAGAGAGGTLTLTDTDSSTVAVAVPVAVAAQPSKLRAKMPITRTQALVC